MKRNTNIKYQKEKLNVFGNTGMQETLAKGNEG